ncbi:60S ribosomal protein L25 [Puccinia graminis f. sp. tritici]|uniref:60S ribosomal protein L25 n=1 Tax=Puccinia graminis f. sp. tritici TaxID=56615 RepID=A0A5B0QQN2_PUCGR|nr:60S ribosomal protein L25 [Puccinia graminis f. sp. tritici]
MDAYRTLVRPLNTESAMKKIEDNNTLLFIVDLKANKRQIADAVKKLYDVTPLRVNTLIRPDGKKKAFVRLTPEVDALDIANKVRAHSSILTHNISSRLITVPSLLDRFHLKICFLRGWVEGDRIGFVLSASSRRGSATMHCNDDSYSYMSNQIYGSFSPTHHPSWGPTIPAAKPWVSIALSCPYLLMFSCAYYPRR